RQDRRPGPAPPDRRAADPHRVAKSPRVGPARSPGEVRPGGPGAVDRGGGAAHPPPPSDPPPPIPRPPVDQVVLGRRHLHPHGSRRALPVSSGAAGPVVIV